MSVFNKCLGFALLFYTAFLATPTYASTTGNVGSADVTKGKTKVEARISYSEGNEDSSSHDRIRTRVQVDHGFTHWYAGRIQVEQDKRQGNNYEHANIRFVNRFQLLDADTSGLDFGVRVNYQLNDGDKKPDVVSAGLFQTIPMGPYQFRINQLFAHDIGEDAQDGVSAELRLQATRKISETHRFGFEGYHDLGNLTELSGYSAQEHEFGPVIKGKIFDTGLGYDLAYRRGISKGAQDNNIKFFVHRSF